MYHSITEWVKLMRILITTIDIDQDLSLQDTASQGEDGTLIIILPIEVEVDMIIIIPGRTRLEERNMRLPCISTNARYAQNLTRKVLPARRSEPSLLAQTSQSFGGR
jgi:hypothetical protein